MPLPTEPIGSIPRPPELIEAARAAEAGELAQEELAPMYEHALRDTIERLEATGSPVISDGEQTKPSFATYPLAGLETLAPVVSRSRSRTATCAACRASQVVRSATRPTPTRISRGRSRSRASRSSRR